MSEDLKQVKRIGGEFCRRLSEPVCRWQVSPDKQPVFGNVATCKTKKRRAPRWFCGCLSQCVNHMSENPMSPTLVQVESVFSEELQLRLATVDSTTIRVLWGEPSGGYSWYKIRYRRVDGGKWKFVSPGFGEHTYDLTDLKPDTDYEVQIENKALSREQQRYTSGVIAQTEPGLPTPKTRGPIVKATRNRSSSVPYLTQKYSRRTSIEGKPLLNEGLPDVVGNASIYDISQSRNNQPEPSEGGYGMEYPESPQEGDNYSPFYNDGDYLKSWNH